VSVQSRVQLALNVDDVEAATAFYRRLFGVEPAKTRPGYANFAVADPPLKLVLLENSGQGGTLNPSSPRTPPAPRAAVPTSRTTRPPAADPTPQQWPIATTSGGPLLRPRRRERSCA